MSIKNELGMVSNHFDPWALKARVARDFGFLTESDVNCLRQHPESRLWPCVVRCGGGRALVAAQDVAWIVGLVEAGGDYVRDVSLKVEVAK